ncbi:hypothetical protein ELY33_17175 [Vreelandella andesensis]|uniref:Putative DnaT-like domain-containing protein n=1 Tax=Vreelandella andesensis TaxID=447567 RepID=A0A433KF14_9GAMM|nr:DnaT-like ssDNA-binding protein [Halomonas andesensis]RUR26840.1 hypothetical protein ELY33_17175 [Halomonas andesensis]
MTEYVTTADVEGVLGTDWEGAGDAARAILEANTWLTSRRVNASDPVEADIITAGAYLAQMAAEGALYADRTPALKRKRVKADTVESELEYQDNATASNGRLRLVLDLLRPYLPAGGGSTFDVRRA